jgi:acylphosphatase
VTDPTRDGRLVRLDAVVSGRVQGVGFRYFVHEAASSRSLVGWVANAPDGSVRCVAEGTRPVLERLLVDLERGPMGARVDRVAAVWGGAAGGFDRFSVRSGAHAGD